MHGGFYDNYATVQGTGQGHPRGRVHPRMPSPAGDGPGRLMKLQDLIQKEKLDEHLWHPKYKALMP